MAKDLTKGIKELVEQNPSGLVLLGTEHVRRSRALSFCIETLRKSVDHLTIGRYSSSEITPRFFAQLSDATNTLSLFSAHQLFIIQDIENLNADFQRKFIPFLTDPIQGVSVFFVGDKLPAQAPLRAAALKRDCLLELKTLQGIELRGWAQRECAKSEKKIARSALELLIEISDDNLDIITHRIEQLILYAAGDIIEESEVRSLFQVKFGADDFALLQSLIQSDPLKKQSRILQASNVNPYGLVSLLQRNIMAAASLHESQRARTTLSLAPWMAQKLAGAAKRITKEVLAKNLVAIIRMESRLKHRSLHQKDIVALLRDEMG